MSKVGSNGYATLERTLQCVESDNLTFCSEQMEAGDLWVHNSCRLQCSNEAKRLEKGDSVIIIHSCFRNSFEFMIPYRQITIS